MNDTTQRTYRAGSIELRHSELSAASDEGKCAIIGHRRVYEFHRTCSGFQISLAYRHMGNLPLVGKGRFFIMDVAGANRIIGFDLFQPPTR